MDWHISVKTEKIEKKYDADFSCQKIFLNCICCFYIYFLPMIIFPIEYNTLSDQWAMISISIFQPTIIKRIPLLYHIFSKYFYIQFSKDTFIFIRLYQVLSVSKIQRSIYWLFCLKISYILKWYSSCFILKPYFSIHIPAQH